MTTELTTTSSGGMSVMNRLDEFQKAAKLFYESGMFSDTKSAAQCFVKIMAGAELGIPPFTAMNAFHVIQGKPVMTANTIAARLKSSGKYNYRITEKTGERCAIDFYEGKDKVHTEVWDAKRAQRAGVKNMDKYPEAMLFARCITAGARAIAPDVVGQFYTPDELGAEVDADGVIISAPSPAAALPPAAEPTKPPPQIVDVTSQYLQKQTPQERWHEWASTVTINLNTRDAVKDEFNKAVIELKLEESKPVFDSLKSAVEWLKAQTQPVIEGDVAV
jgi:hypothetical protein